MSLLTGEGLKYMLDTVIGNLKDLVIQPYSSMMPYAQGAKVKYRDHIYVTSIGHEPEYFDPTHNMLWLHGYVFDPYNNKYKYCSNTIVTYNGNVYKTTINHDGENFDPEKHELLFSIPNTNIGTILPSVELDISMGGNGVVSNIDIVMILGNLIEGTILYDANMSVYLTNSIVPDTGLVTITCIAIGYGKVPTSYTGNINTYRPLSVTVQSKGSGYVHGDPVTLSNGMTGFIYVSGGQVIDYADTGGPYSFHVSGGNITISSSNSGNGSGASFIVTETYGDGDDILIGSMKDVNVYDPLVQVSRMANYVQEQLTSVSLSLDDDSVLGSNLSPTIFTSSDGSISISRNVDGTWDFIVAEEGGDGIRVTFNLTVSTSGLLNATWHIQKYGESTPTYSGQASASFVVVKSLEKFTGYAISVINNDDASLGIFEREITFKVDGTGNNETTYYTSDADTDTVDVNFTIDDNQFYKMHKTKFLQMTKSDLFSKTSGTVDAIYFESAIPSSNYPFVYGSSTDSDTMFCMADPTDGTMNLHIYRGNALSANEFNVTNSTLNSTILSDAFAANGWTYSTGEYMIIVDPIGNFLQIVELSTSTVVVTRDLNPDSMTNTTMVGCFIANEVIDNEDTILLMPLFDNTYVDAYLYSPSSLITRLVSSNILLPMTIQQGSITGIMPGVFFTALDVVAFVYMKNILVFNFDGSDVTYNSSWSKLNRLDFWSLHCSRFMDLAENSILIPSYDSTNPDSTCQVFEIGTNNLMLYNRTNVYIERFQNHQMNNKAYDHKYQVIKTMHNFVTTYYRLNDNYTMTEITNMAYKRCVIPNNNSHVVMYDPSSYEIQSLDVSNAVIPTLTYDSNFTMHVSVINDKPSIMLHDQSKGIIGTYMYNNITNDIVSTYQLEKDAYYADATYLPFIVDRYMILSKSNNDLVVWDYINNTESTVMGSSHVCEGAVIGDYAYLIPLDNYSYFLKLELSSGTITNLSTNGAWSSGEVRGAFASHYGTIYIYGSFDTYIYNPVTDTMVQSNIGPTSSFQASAYLNTYYAVQDNTISSFGSDEYNQDLTLRSTSTPGGIPPTILRSTMLDLNHDVFTDRYLFILKNDLSYTIYDTITDSSYENNGYQYSVKNTNLITSRLMPDNRYYFVENGKYIGSVKPNIDGQIVQFHNTSQIQDPMKIMVGINGKIYVSTQQGQIYSLIISNFNSPNYPNQWVLTNSVDQGIEPRIAKDTNNSNICIQDPNNFMVSNANVYSTTALAVNNLQNRANYFNIYTVQNNVAVSRNLTGLPLMPIKWAVVINGTTSSGDVVALGSDKLFYRLQIGTGPNLTTPSALTNDSGALMVLDRDTTMFNNCVAGYDESTNKIAIAGFVNSNSKSIVVRSNVEVYGPIQKISILHRNSVVMIDNNNIVHLYRCSHNSAFVDVDTYTLTESALTATINTPGTVQVVVASKLEDDKERCSVVMDNGRVYIIEIPHDDDDRIRIYQSTVTNGEGYTGEYVGIAVKGTLDGTNILVYYTTYVLSVSVSPHKPSVKLDLSNVQLGSFINTGVIGCAGYLVAYNTTNRVNNMKYFTLIGNHFENSDIITTLDNYSGCNLSDLAKIYRTPFV